MSRSVLVLAWIIATVAGAVASAAPESAVPDTPVGKVFAAWLEVSNSGDRAQVQAFKDRYQFTAPVERMLAVREQTGGLELVRIEQSTERSLTALMKGKGDDRPIRAVLSISPTDPPVIENIGLLPARAPPPEAAPVERMTEAAALSALRAHADELAKQDEFSGALLVARHGKVLLEDAWGLADRGTGRRATVDTQFNLGSMNKMFTAVAILQLVEAGKVSLEATVGTYLPDYPNRDVAEKVTVRELLNHTGGTGDFVSPEWFANRDSIKEHADYIKLLGARGPDHEPGKEFRYSNYGFILLGAIIERVSGVSYYEYVDGHIFKPAGMRGTDSLPQTAKKPSIAGRLREAERAGRAGTVGRAVPYTKRNGALSENDQLPYRGSGAGGGYSTVGDLLKFARALEAGKLISLKSLHEATRLQTPPGTSERAYGYGFVPEGEGSLRNYGHGGGTLGVNGYLRIFPELGVVVVCLSNRDPPAAERLVSYYAQRMPSQ